MRPEVEVGAVRDPFELPPVGEREPVLDIDRALGIVRELVGVVLADPEVILAEPQVGPPAHPLADPELVPVLVGAGLDEELHLHLLELPLAEDEVPRGDLVAERSADLRDPEGDLLAAHLLDRPEVDEHPLCGLGAQVHRVLGVLDRAHVRLEHQVEVAGLREGRLTAVRAYDRFGEFISAEPLVAVQALDQGVGEDLEVAGCLPDLGRHDHGSIEPDDVVAELHGRTPPLLADVALDLGAERPVVPGRAEPAVDLRGLERDPPPFGEGGDGLHQVRPWQVGHETWTPFPVAGCGRRRAAHATGVNRGCRRPDTSCMPSDHSAGRVAHLSPRTSGGARPAMSR